jgi:hypothetical protein
MKRVLRISLMIVALFGIIVLARNQVAWAANSSGTTNQIAPQLVEKNNSQGWGDDCEKPWNKNRDRCRDKDKDKDKCKHNRHCGSVKPPPRQLIIPVTGEYSVGGFCTLIVTLNDSKINLDAILETPLPDKLPDRVQKMPQGCLLTYYSSHKRISKLSVGSGNTTICFAATPRKQVTVYFYDIYSPHPKWIPLETTVQDGSACSSGNASGVYVATFQKP